MNNNFNYETKKGIVEKGGSKIFMNRSKFQGIKEEDFIAGLKWLCGDQRDENGKLTRELGCLKGKLVKLHRANGMFTAFYEEETGMLWNGKVSISAEDRI